MTTTSPRPRARNRHDDGFTLVELMVALTVLAVGILGTAQVFFGAMNATAATTARNRAVSLATREIERLRGIPYEQLGFAPSQPGFVATFEGDDTVEVVSPLASPATSEELVVGIRFRVDRAVVWSDPGPSYPEGYKRVAVHVGWTDRSGQHTVRQDSFVYPGGLGPYAGAGGNATSTSDTRAPAAPIDLIATVRPGDAGAGAIDLSWTAVASDPAAATWVIEYSLDGFATAHRLTDRQPAASTTYSATGLSPSSTYYFRVAARSAAGVDSLWSSTATATTAAGTVAVCEMGTGTVTPAAVRRHSGASMKLAEDAAVGVNTSGPCSGLRLVYRPTAGTGATTGMLLVDGVWQANVDGTGTDWDLGNHELEVRDSSDVLLGRLTFTVCARNVRSCP